MLADCKPRRHTSVAPYLIVAFAAGCSPDAPESGDVATAGHTACDGCDVVRTLEAGIGDVEGPGTIGDQGTLARGPDGRLYLWTPFDPGMVKVFAADGRYLTSTGRVGSGPGEYKAPGVIVPDADGVTIFDWAAIRVTRLSPDLQHESTQQMPVHAGGAVRLGPSLYAVTADTRRGGSDPLHAWDAAGNAVLRSFGADAPGRPAQMWSPRIAAADDGRSIWVWWWRPYRIERWDTQTGTLVDVIERDVAWFPAEATTTAPPNVEPPSTTLGAAVQDDDGLLWVLIHAASSDWTPLEPVRTPSGETYTSNAQNNLLYDSIIEVLDPATGGLVASGRFAGRIAGFVGPGRVYQAAEDEVGNPRYDLYRLSIEPAS